jgi:hypothetical protein
VFKVTARKHLSGGLLDCLFLAAIVGASTLGYIGRLGFYSDDWDFLALLANAEDPSLPGLIRGQFGTNLDMRPTQIVYQAALFRLFQLDPFGYHVVNAGVLVAVAVLLYLILRAVGLPRGLAVAVPAVYLLLPNHATNRFWFAAFGYPLSIALYLFSLYADLRGASSRSTARWTWKIAGAAALAMALLGYEVVLPLVLVSAVLAEVVTRRAHGVSLYQRLGAAGFLLFHGLTAVVVTAVVAYKVSVAAGLGLNSPLFAYLVRLVSGAVATNFGTHALGLPHTVAWAVPHAGAAGLVIALIVALGTYRYLGAIPETWTRADPAVLRWIHLRLAAVGLIIFVLGYAIFFTTGRIGFSSTGIANRVSAAAALGSAMVVLALAGWLGAWLPTAAARDRAFRGVVAVLCGCGIIVTHGVASFWTESWNAQQRVLAALHADLPQVSPGTTVLLQGVCPYEGPAIVFESSWDLRGALRTRYSDRSLEADVTSGRIAIEPHGVVTRIYQAVVVHPYGPDLLLYDYPGRRTTVLIDEAVARHAVATDQLRSQCAPGRAGSGALVLPFDALIAWVESRVWRGAVVHLPASGDAPPQTGLTDWHPKQSGPGEFVHETH